MSNTDTQKTSDTRSAVNGRVGSSESSAPILRGIERRKAFGVYWETKRDFLEIQIGEGLGYALFSRGWDAADELLAMRDRRIAELEKALRVVKDSGGYVCDVKALIAGALSSLPNGRDEPRPLG